MFIPKFTITQRTLKNVGIIDASREVIRTTALIPNIEAKFRKEAFERIVHHSTHLEGNALTFEQVQEIAEGRPVQGRERDVAEVHNYKNVLKFLEAVSSQIGVGNSYVLTLETIQEIHRLTTEHLLPAEASGKLRLSQVVVRNTQTGDVSYTPPPAAEVPYLIEDLLNWVNAEETRDFHPVIKAGIVHYELGRIYPFVDGNGRTARAVALLLLYLEGYDFRKFICLEEYYDKNHLNYYLTLQSVSNQMVLDVHERDLTPWINYFVHGMAVEVVNLKERVKQVSIKSHVKDQLGEEMELTERQMIIMEYLQRHKFMRNSDFRKIFPDFSDDTVLRELKFMKQKGLVKKVGGTKKAQYVLK